MSPGPDRWAPQRVEPRRKRRRSPSDLHSRAERLAERTEEARKERRASWGNGGQNESATIRQEKALAKSGQDKRALRRDIYKIAPDLEGRPVFRRSRPVGA